MDTSPENLDGLLRFLRDAEALKATLRSGHTSAGRRESTAEHTWRLALMAVVLAPELPEIDTGRLLRMCLVHDLGEALAGDVPAPEQDGDPDDRTAREREAMVQLTEPLPERQRRLVLDLWREYTDATTPEARIAKGLDKLETCLQHAQAEQAPGFDYRFNLGYGRRWTDGHPLLAALRDRVDEETEHRARDTSSDRCLPPD
jgi:putative hydrolases of HD superfamily